MDITLVKKLALADIISNNLNDDTTQLWTPNTAYTYSDTATTIVRVNKAADGVTPVWPEILYELLADSPAGKHPDSDKEIWFNNGAIGKDKAFDPRISTQACADGTEATYPGQIVWELDASTLTSVSLFGLVGTHVTFELRDGRGVLVDFKKYDLIDNSHIDNIVDYLFAEFLYIQNITHDFPIYHSSTLKITIENTEEDRYPKCGYVILGKEFYIGVSQDDFETGILDFTPIQRNTFGTLYTDQRDYADTIDVDVKFETVRLDIVKRALTSIRGVPTVFDGNNSGRQYTSLRALGVCVKFRTRTKGRYTIVTMTIEGLT